jgi:hypothetical protein
MKDVEHVIHTVGDSHAFQHGCIEPIPSRIVQHHLGPVLCYSFGKEKLKRCDIRNFNIKNGDSIIFCLGEIDCRCHIHKHINDKVSYQNIIDYIVDNYFEAINLNIETSQINLKNICVYNVVPPIQIDNTPEDPTFPFLGSDEERKEYVLYFNKKLKENCKKYRYVFFDIYNHYTDENGFLIKDLSDGNVHLKDKSYLRDFILKNNI